MGKSPYFVATTLVGACERLCYLASNSCCPCHGSASRRLALASLYHALPARLSAQRSAGSGGPWAQDRTSALFKKVNHEGSPRFVRDFEAELRREVNQVQEKAAKAAQKRALAAVKNLSACPAVSLFSVHKIEASSAIIAKPTGAVNSSTSAPIPRQSLIWIGRF